MNNIKKFLSLLFVAILALVLIGCGGTGSEDEVILNEQADKIYLGDLSEINNDIKLPKYAFGNKEFPVTWASSNEQVIKVQEYENADKDLYYQASVTMALEVTNVTLTATVTYKELTTTREFVVTVLADEYKGYETIAAVKAQDDKTKDVSMVKFSGTVAFSTGSGFGVTDGKDTIYCYGSGHGRTVGEKVEVRGIWTFYNNMVQLKNFNVKVLGVDANFNIANIAEEKSIAEIFAIKAESVDPVNSTRIFKTKFAAKENASGSYNTYRLVDPLDNSKTVDVSKYNDATTLEEVGTLAASGKFYEGIIIIYCSRSAGAAGLWDVLYVPGTAKEVEITLSDAQKVAGILGNLNDQFSGKTVKENLELPTADTTYGATISWASDKEDVISSTGVYVAPAAMTEVKLTATVTLNSEVQTVEITVKAAAKQTSILKYVTEIEVGKAYKLGIEQSNLEKTIFATGELSGKYGVTTEDYASGADVYFETAEGGYYVYFLNGEAKSYISATATTAEDGKVSYSLVYGEKSTVWTFDTEYFTLKANVEGTDVYFGCYNQYNTISVSKFSYVSTSFPSRFYVEIPLEPTYVKEIEVGKAYKLGIEQSNLEKTIFATGELSGKYGVTTEDYASGADVYFETAEGGYYVYFLNGEAKSYISATATTAEDGKVSYSLVYGEKSTVWTFDTEYFTLKANVEGTDVYFGCYNQYNTISVSKFSYVSTSFPSRFYVLGAGEEETPEPEPKPEPTDKEATIAEVLEAAKDLEDKAKLEGKYVVTGTVTEITAEYSDQYKNVSFIITDGTNTLEIYRTKGEEAANVAAGDTVVLVGEIQKYGEKIQLVSGEIKSRKAAGSEDAAPTVKDILDAAATLESQAKLEGEYTVTGKVTSITAEYSEQYKNISFMLSDGTGEILCYRCKGDDAAALAVGDTITLTGEIINYNGTIEFQYAVISARVAGEGTGTEEKPEEKPEDKPAESNADAVLTFDSEANRTAFSEEEQVWSSNGITVTNNVHESTNPIADYKNPARFYANTSLVIEYTSKISKIVITTTGGKNVDPAIVIEGATLVVDGEVATITLNTPATSVTIAKLSKQMRVTKIEVYVEK